MSGAVLDTGALVGFERNDRRVVAIVARALEHGGEVLVAPGLEPDRVRLGLRGGDAGARERLRLVLLAARGEEEPLDVTAQRLLDRVRPEGLGLS